ncbi:SKN7, two-component response regulator [Coprinopsis sp. MPI-PUGE-AT-0042]|nr:SKN7, two-component response regulator [Coprinopsis sp. MPI-PUGE-AT-0042]
MVQPSINTTDENGDLVVQNSSNTLPGSASATSPRTSQAHASSSSSAQARRDIGNEEPLSISTPGVLANSRRTNTGAGSATDGKPTIRVRRSTFVPGWAVPPRVLLVDDDAVSRKLSSKFLQVFGCTTDIAVDGVGAVNKMNLEKYDLVLMDIVMPKLDGVSATSIIRKFDKGTPIISMTSNSKPNEIMTYYSSGMNDILPKPFTKQGLLDMLEKHLMHLKVIQQMQRNIPRGPGVPPLSDFNFEQALAMAFGFYGQEQNGEDAGLDNRINPLAGMGLSDEQFIMMAQMVNSGDGGGATMMYGVGINFGMSDSPPSGGGTKRGLEDGSDMDGPMGKKSRFEVIE